MDIDATVNELRVIMARVLADGRLSQADVERAAELFNQLDIWMAHGGWLPEAWNDAFSRLP